MNIDIHGDDNTDTVLIHLLPLTPGQDIYGRIFVQWTPNEMQIIRYRVLFILYNKIQNPKIEIKRWFYDTGQRNWSSEKGSLLLVDQLWRNQDLILTPGKRILYF